jgi:DNA invertase Pin-like site-specific DNA recombinase
MKDRRINSSAQQDAGSVIRECSAVSLSERPVIQERVKAGLRNAKAKGQRLGRPPVVVDKDEISAMRDAGASWRAIAEKLGVGLGTVHRIAQRRSKNVCGTFGTDSPGAPSRGYGSQRFLI